MTAMTVDGAKNIAIGVALVLLIIMVLFAWLVKNVTTKLISVVILAGLVFFVWTQRTSLEDCAGKVKARAALGDRSDITCTFLGSDIKVSVPAAP